MALRFTLVLSTSAQRVIKDMGRRMSIASRSGPPIQRNTVPTEDCSHESLPVGNVWSAVARLLDIVYGPVIVFISRLERG